MSIIGVITNCELEDTCKVFKQICIIFRAKRKEAEGRGRVMRETLNKDLDAQIGGSID